jgi:hypothetical protein
MPRQLSENVENKLTINDPATGEAITFLYRQPTTEERIRYAKSLQKIKRKGQKVDVEDNIYPTRIKFGIIILTGFVETKKDDITGELAGGFVDEKGKPFSSVRGQDNFRDDWKQLVQKFAAELVEFLARKVFEGVSEAVDLGFGDDDGDDAEGDTHPA